jgi:hypothetical protein
MPVEDVRAITASLPTILDTAWAIKATLGRYSRSEGYIVS